MLEEERVRDINLCIGAGEQELEFVCAGTGSTFSKEIAEEGDFGHCARHKKKVLTLTQIYQQYCSEKQEVHFCKIDVEGFEKEVLKGCNFNIFRPWIFLVESAKVLLTSKALYVKMKLLKCQCMRLKNILSFKSLKVIEKGVCR